MKDRRHAEIVDVARLQALGRLRWRVLLGYPRMRHVIATRLRKLVRDDDPLAEAWSAWWEASAAMCRGASGAPVGFRAATRRLADLLSRQDRLGASAASLAHATAAALAGRSTAASLSHGLTVGHICDEFLGLRNRLVTEHLGLVRLAVHRLNIPAGRREDMLHEGVFGLIRALECFDPSRGTRFSTYAMYWIRTEIMRAMSQCEHEIRVPPHVLANRRAYKHHRAALEAWRPTAELRERAKAAAGLTERQLRVVESIPEIDASSAGERASARPVDPLGDLQTQRMVQDLWLALPELNERERQIIAHRFELEGKEERTLKQLASALGLSRERVRQIQLGALEKLRARIGEAA